jgi:hypothetical protein
MSACANSSSTSGLGHTCTHKRLKTHTACSSLQAFFGAAAGLESRQSPSAIAQHITRIKNAPVLADDNSVVALKGLECQLLAGLHLLCLHLVDLGGKHGSGLGSRVNAAGLDADHKVAAVLQEVVRVQSNDLRLSRNRRVLNSDAQLSEHSTNLIGLGDVSKDDINHADEHAVLVGVAGILNNGDNVGALLGLDCM